MPPVSAKFARRGPAIAVEGVERMRSGRADRFVEAVEVKVDRRGALRCEGAGDGARRWTGGRDRTRLNSEYIGESFDTHFRQRQPEGRPGSHTIHTQPIARTQEADEDVPALGVGQAQPDRPPGFGVNRFLRNDLPWICGHGCDARTELQIFDGNHVPIGQEDHRALDETRASEEAARDERHQDRFLALPDIIIPFEAQVRGFLGELAAIAQFEARFLELIQGTRSIGLMIFERREDIFVEGAGGAPPDFPGVADALMTIGPGAAHVGVEIIVPVFEAFLFRTSDQHEIDLVLDFGKSRWAIEVKLSSSPSPQDMDRLNQAAQMIGADRRFLISKTRESVDEGNRVSCNLASMLKMLSTARSGSRA